MSTSTIHPEIASHIVAVPSHDRWFCELVEQGLAEADNPETNWISNHEASESWAKKRAELIQRVEGSFK